MVSNENLWFHDLPFLTTPHLLHCRNYLTTIHSGTCQRHSWMSFCAVYFLFYHWNWIQKNSFIYKRFFRDITFISRVWQLNFWSSGDSNENAPDRNLFLCSVLGIVLSFLSTIDNKDTSTFLKPFKSEKFEQLQKRKKIAEKCCYS